MKNELEYIGKSIISDKRKLAERLTKKLIDSVSGTINDSGIDEIVNRRMIFLEAIGKAFIEEYKEEAEQTIERLGKEAGEIAVRLGLPLHETLDNIVDYREVIWDAVAEKTSENELAPITIVDASRIFDPLLYRTIHLFCAKYVEHHQKTIESARTAIQELSAPIVPIVQGIAILPIIGEVDTARAKLLMDSTLQRSIHLGLHKLIIDLSGVPILDTMVAQQLFQINKALKVIGVETVITGIRPEIAQTAVALGLDFTGIHTYGNLQQALFDLGIRLIDTPVG